VIARTDKGRRVQQRLFADRPQCVALVGDPRIGKTSFLDWLAAAVEARDPEPPAGTRFVRLSLRDEPLGGPEPFLSTVVARLAEVERRSVPPAPPTAPAESDRSGAYAAFESAVKRIHGEGGRLILLLDDFDSVTRSSEYPLSFFSFMRSLANNFAVAYVTTSRLDLQQLCALKEVEESPFFNIFQNVSLGPMPEDLLRALAAECAGVPADSPAADWAWAESSGLPEVAKGCCEVVKSGTTPGSDEAVEALDARLGSYFEELWEHLAPEHRALVERVARGEAPGPRDARPLRDLGPRRGYLVERDGAWQVAPGALRRQVTGGRPASSPGLLTRIGRFFGGGGR
jgi:serine/threonine-protein kinase